LFREEFDDWAILFDPDTSDAFGLNPVSAFIWRCLDGRTSIADVAGKLGKECEDMPEDAMDYIKKFVDELVEKGYAGYGE
jgi:SynChlorMet cassette protein ScmD